MVDILGGPAQNGHNMDRRKASSQWLTSLEECHRPMSNSRQEEHRLPFLTSNKFMFDVCEQVNWYVVHRSLEKIPTLGNHVSMSPLQQITYMYCSLVINVALFCCKALRDGKRLITAYWLNDCLLVRRMSVPCIAIHFPYVFGKERPCSSQVGFCWCTNCWY